MIQGLTSRHTLIRERPLLVDDGRGGHRSDFTDVVGVDLHGWALDAGATTKDTQNRDGSLIAWTARGPFGADVERHDRITVFGERYKINGAVVRQPGPSPLTSHTILLLERWDG